jgi:Fe-S-cluster containining protein
MRDFPGNAATGVLDEDEDAEERFAAFADEEPCPALDTETLTCDLYDARPVTCRIFGPAVRSGGDVLGVCELNYVGATDEQIAACQVEVDTEGLEDELLEGDQRQTIVAFALAGDRR